MFLSWFDSEIQTGNKLCKNKSNYELIQVAKNSAITELVHKLDYDLDKWIEFSTSLYLKPSE